MNENHSIIPTKLELILQRRAPLLIALSGGQDSSVLLATAKTLDLPIEAATIISEFAIPEEIGRAKIMCKQLGVSWTPIKIQLLKDIKIQSNPMNRCYLCKQKLMQPLLELANDIGCCICDGTHADDSPKERPGYAVLHQLGVCSPFAEAGIRKADILFLAKKMGIPRIPPSSCLATRLPFGVTITKERLNLIATAETLLRRQGVSGILRVRLIPNKAVVEVEAWEMKKVLSNINQLKMLGFSNVQVAIYKEGCVDRWKESTQ
ncbi:MAG TPA: 7-cyano-7-deazaguanine synthase [Methanocorpusculum sp.]|nr:7-cyano-7-deazaguanine synthase [Methanocorpusculum sp.]HJK02340.1 7-cyano-7-deazaguanine synthase [Methanocorpusculum sp.]